MARASYGGNDIDLTAEIVGGGMFVKFTATLTRMGGWVQQPSNVIIMKKVGGSMADDITLNQDPPGSDTYTAQVSKSVVAGSTRRVEANLVLTQPDKPAASVVIV
jgi:hypothetical protein